MMGRLLRRIAAREDFVPRRALGSMALSLAVLLAVGAGVWFGGPRLLYATGLWSDGGSPTIDPSLYVADADAHYCAGADSGTDSDLRSGVDCDAYADSGADADAHSDPGADREACAPRNHLRRSRESVGRTRY